MSEFKALKFIVKDENQSESLQKVLFKLGYFWPRHGAKVSYTDQIFIYTNKFGHIKYYINDQMSYFTKHENQQMDTEQFIMENTKMTLDEKIAAIKAKRPELKVGMRVKIRDVGGITYTVVPCNMENRPAVVFVNEEGWIEGYYEQHTGGIVWDVMEVKDIPPPYQFFSNYHSLASHTIWTREQEEKEIEAVKAEHFKSQENESVNKAEALVKEAQKQLDEAVAMLKKAKGE